MKNIKNLFNKIYHYFIKEKEDSCYYISSSGLCTCGCSAERVDYKGKCSFKKEKNFSECYCFD